MKNIVYAVSLLSAAINRGGPVPLYGISAGSCSAETICNQIHAYAPVTGHLTLMKEAVSAVE